MNIVEGVAFSLRAIERLIEVGRVLSHAEGYNQ